MKNLDLRTFAELMVAMVGQRGILCHVGERNGCICVVYENDNFSIPADVNLLWQKYSEGADVTVLADALASALSGKIEAKNRELANQPKVQAQPRVQPYMSNQQQASQPKPQQKTQPYMNLGQQVNQRVKPHPQQEQRVDMDMVNRAARQAVKEILGANLPDNFDVVNMLKNMGVDIRVEEAPNVQEAPGCNCGRNCNSANSRPVNVNHVKPSAPVSDSFDESLRSLVNALGGNTEKPQQQERPSDEDIKFEVERVNNNIRPMFISDEMKAEMPDALVRKVLGMNLAYYMPGNVMQAICDEFDDSTGIAFIRTEALNDSGMTENEVYESAMNNLAPHVRIETADMINVTSCAVISDEDCGAAGILCKGVLSSIADAFGEDNLYVLVMNCNETAVFPASKVNVGNLKAIIDNEAREKFDIMGDLLLYSRENDVLAAPSYNI